MQINLSLQRGMDKSDRNDLRTAVVLLERPRLGIRLISLVGYPIEGILKTLLKAFRP